MEIKQVMIIKDIENIGRAWFTDNMDLSDNMDPLLQSFHDSLGKNVHGVDIVCMNDYGIYDYNRNLLVRPFLVCPSLSIILFKRFKSRRIINAITKPRQAKPMLTELLPIYLGASEGHPA